MRFVEVCERFPAGWGRTSGCGLGFVNVWQVGIRLSVRFSVCGSGRRVDVILFSIKKLGTCVAFSSWEGREGGEVGATPGTLRKMGRKPEYSELLLIGCLTSWCP